MTAYRLPDLPADLDAELVLLGCMIRDPALLDRAQLKEDLFHQARYRQAFRALAAHVVEGKPLDFTTATAVCQAAEVTQPGSLCAEACERALDAMPQLVVPHLRAYARRRACWRLGWTLLTTSGRAEIDREIVESAADQLASLTADHADELEVVESRHAAADWLSEITNAAIGVRSGLLTGFRDLDRLIGGLPAGELVLVAARPAVGKSAFAHQIAVRTARAGKTVLVASPEMSVRQVIGRVLCQLGPVDSDNVFRVERVSATTIARLRGAAQSMPGFWLYDSVGTTADLRSVARRLHARQPLDLLIVDHLGWLQDPLHRGENRATLVGRMTKAIKALARQLGCACLVVSQLNRASEDGEVMRRPGLAELRESGELEQDGDTVLLLHRVRRDATTAECIVAKARNGPIGIVPLVWQPPFTRFVDAAWQGETGEARR